GRPSCLLVGGDLLGRLLVRLALRVLRLGDGEVCLRTREALVHTSHSSLSSSLSSILIPISIAALPSCSRHAFAVARKATSAETPPPGYGVSISRSYSLRARCSTSASSSGLSAAIRPSTIAQPAAFFFSRDLAEGLQSSSPSRAGHSLPVTESHQYVALRISACSSGVAWSSRGPIAHGMYQFLRRTSWSPRA